MSLKLLVTGGAGFIGSHIVEQALARGYEVAVLDNLTTGKRENVPASAKLYQADLRDAAATEQVLREFRPDAISHQAAQASVAVSVKDPALDVHVNVLGGVHLLDASVKYGVKRVVFASTGGAIYGEVAEGRLATEDDSPHPISPYAVSKLAFEHLLACYQRYRGLSSTVLRYANVYGPRQDPFGEAGVVAIFFDRALRGQPLHINGRNARGDAGCIRDYTYVADVARANLLSLSGELSQSFMNVATGEATTTQALAEKIRQLTGTESTIVSGEPRAGDLERSVLDPARCRRALGALVDLERGLQETYAWFQKQHR